MSKEFLTKYPCNKARIEFRVRFLLALFTHRTINLARLATTFSGSAWGDFQYLIAGSNEVGAVVVSVEKRGSNDCSARMGRVSRP